VLLDGRLASGSDDGTIRLWDLRTGAEITVIGG
jgi:WD40 repeat protein